RLRPGCAACARRVRRCGEGAARLRLSFRHGGRPAGGGRARPRAARRRGRGDPERERSAPARPRMTTFDVVVAGAGHNSLVTAAYLAKAGYEVCVLEARELAGGGAVSEELTIPGYLFDSCSTGHTLLQPNPLMRDDELGLKSEYGLEYISPDPIAHVVFPDGESFTHWLDLDRTCDEIARFSRRDADSYRRALAEFDEIRAPLGRYRFNPIGYAPSLEEAL